MRSWLLNRTIDEGLVKVMIDQDTYMLHERSSSRKQLFCKALVEKLED